MKSSSKNFWTSEIKVIRFFSSISVWVPPLRNPDHLRQGER